MTDTHIETAAVLDAYLGLVSRMTVPPVNTFKECELMCDTITFLRKYDCDGLMQLIKTECTNRLLLERIPPLYVFMMAATMDDVSWCVMALDRAYEVEEKAKDEAPYINLALLSLSPTSRTDGGTWPLELHHRLPLQYAWAVTSAWTQCWGYRYANACLTGKPGHRTFVGTGYLIAMDFQEKIELVKGVKQETDDEIAEDEDASF